jgi:hypothetical protein
MAGYSSLAPLMSYDPSKPSHPGNGADGNPALIHFAVDFVKMRLLLGLA